MYKKSSSYGTSQSFFYENGQDFLARHPVFQEPLKLEKKLYMLYVHKNEKDFLDIQYLKNYLIVELFFIRK